MSEVEPVSISGVLGFDLGDTVVTALMRRGDLPPDFYLRALTLPRGTRDAVVAADVLTAAGIGDRSGTSADYLHAPLPDCMFVYGVEDISYLYRVLRTTPEDFHQLNDLRLVVRDHKIDDKYAYMAWEEWVGKLNPELRQMLIEFRHPSRKGERYTFGRQYQIARLLGRSVIKDTALVDIYESMPPGSAPMRRTILRALLADNHPEYIA